MLKRSAWILPPPPRRHLTPALYEQQRQKPRPKRRRVFLHLKPSTLLHPITSLHCLVNGSMKPNTAPTVAIKMVYISVTISKMPPADISKEVCNHVFNNYLSRVATKNIVSLSIPDLS